MPTRRTRGTRSSPHGIIGSVALLLAITASAALAGSSRSAREPERIFVTALSGTVSVTMAGASTPVQLDSTVGLPARIVTGDDGMLSLTQAGTNVTIAADSDVEIPAEAADGQLIARLVQRRGNVFYDVAHREAGTLRVETPFLVAVIKGTQFNVAAEEGGSTISLFQGRLEIKTPDGSDSVFINAGQIARRSSADNAISVIGMNDRRVDLPRGGNSVARNAAASDDALQPRVFASPAAARDLPATATLARIESVPSPAEVDRPTRGIGADVDLNGSVSGGRTLRAGNGPLVSVNAGAGNGAVVSVNANAGPGMGGLPASVGANVSVGTGSSDVSVGASIGVGGGGAPITAGANLNGGVGNAGVSLGAGASAAAGGVPASAGANLNVGAGSSGVSLGAAASAAAGGVPASAGANLNVGAGSGVSLGAGVNLGAVSVDVGLGSDGLQIGAGGKGDDEHGLHLGTGGSIGDNLGLHLGIGTGKSGSPGKSRGHP